MKKQVCIKHDLRCENIHRVATLMKDILWLCPERIISRKAWRSINYQSKEIYCRSDDCYILYQTSQYTHHDSMYD
jgi:hypothetical protein